MSLNDHRALTEFRKKELELRVERINERIMYGDKVEPIESDLIALWDHIQAQDLRNLNMSNIVLAMNAIAGALDDIPNGALVNIDEIKVMFGNTLTKYIAPVAEIVENGS